LKSLIYRSFSFINKQRIDEELDEELRFCLELETEANTRRGMSPEEARRAARLKIGGPETIKEACRDERGFPLLESFFQDVRHGFRSLLRTPGFAIAAVSMLALGIGANTAMFSVVKAVLLNPLPYADAGKLVWVGSMSFPNFDDLRNEQTSLVKLAAWDYAELNLTGGSTPLRVTTARFMPSFFEVVASQPFIGRPIRSDDEHIAKEESAVLSYGIWQRAFGGDAEIVGRRILLDDEPYTIRGVMPLGFGFPGNKDIWIPWDVKAERWAGRREVVRLRVIARLASNVTVAEAQKEIDLIWQRLAKEYPETRDAREPKIVTEFEITVGEVEVPLLLLMGTVVLVLLIVCANLAGLLLSRGIYRQKELILRSALGAGRARMTRQLLTETLIMCLPGCGLGLILAYGSVGLLIHLFPLGGFLRGLPRLEQARIDPIVLGFALAMTTVAMLASGLFPAFRHSKPNLQAGLKDGAYATTASERGMRVGNTLVIVQAALSVLLVVGAVLVLKSYMKIVRVDLGFQTENRMTAQTVLSQRRYPSNNAKTHYYVETVDRLKGLPGVLDVAATSNLVFTNLGFFTRSLVVEGRQSAEEQRGPDASWISVSSNFFDVQGIPILRGRSFDTEDSAHSELVTIINRELEKLLFPEGAALGKRIRLFDEWRTIVGIAEGVRTNGPLRGGKGRTIYVPYSQYPTDRITWILKTAVPPESLAGPLRDELHAIDPEQPVYRIETLDHYFLQSVSRNRLNSLLMGFFGFSGLAIACLGLYSIVAFRVSQRIHEVGIRMALGADRGDIFGMVVKHGMVLVVLGVIIGDLAALGLTRFLSSMLFEVDALDTATFIFAVILFLLVGFIACAMPAARAVRLDPTTALRHE